MSKVVIRQEHERDYKGVFEVVKTAFNNAIHTNKDEHNLVERLRKSKAFVPALSLVAEIDGKIVGHIMFTEMTVGEKVALTLAPVSVLSEYQGLGIGSKMIEAGHRIAKKLNYKASVVVGHKNYYPRFGYIKASLYGIKAKFDVPDENFMIVELEEDSLEQYNGVVEFAPEFFDA